MPGTMLNTFMCISSFNRFKNTKGKILFYLHVIDEEIEA